MNYLNEKTPLERIADGLDGGSNDALSEKTPLERIADALDDQASISHEDKGMLDEKGYLERMAIAVEAGAGQGGYPEPTGKITITENGTDINVKDYAKADVNVSGGGSFTIDDAQFLFYNGARLNIMNDLLDLCNNVTNCHCMFSRCSSLTSLDLSNFDTSNVTDMNSMFYYCSSLTSLDLSNFDTLNVTDMNSMFSNCSSLTSLDLSNFNISGVTTMGSMFAFSSFTSIEIGTDDTTYSSNLKNAYLFYNCSSLDSVTIRGTNVMRISDSNAFTGLKSTCKFYVPSNLVDSYKSASNWSTRAGYIYAIS